MEKYTFSVIAFLWRFAKGFKNDTFLNIFILCFINTILQAEPAI